MRDGDSSDDPVTDEEVIQLLRDLDPLRGWEPPELTKTPAEIRTGTNDRMPNRGA